jgi:hypothetical protein
MATATLQNTLSRLSSMKRAWYRAHLADPGLAARGVALEAELAVPLGGTRRGGYIVVVDSESAQAAIKKLRRRAGFPDLRYEPGRDGAPDLVRWGEPEPPPPSAAAPVWAHQQHTRRLARLYGYTETTAFELSGENTELRRPAIEVARGGKEPKATRAKMSAATRAKIAAAKQANWADPDYRSRMGATLLAIVKDPKTRAKMSAAHRSRADAV